MVKFGYDRLSFTQRDNIMELEKYISLEEAAEYIGVKPVTLRGWLKIEKYEVPAHRIGKLWKFKKTELDQWVQSGKSAL